MKLLMSIVVVFIGIGYFYYTKHRVSNSSNETKPTVMAGEEFQRKMQELSPEERAKVNQIIERTKIEWARDNLVSQTEYILRQIPKLKSLMDSESLKVLQQTAESVLPRLKAINLDDPDAEEKMKEIYGELEKVRDDISAEQESKMKKSSQKPPFL